MILLEKGQFIVVNLIEAYDGELEQCNEVFDHIRHPLELFLLFQILILRLLLSVRELDLAPRVAAASHNGASKIFGWCS